MEEKDGRKKGTAEMEVIKEGVKRKKLIIIILTLLTRPGLLKRTPGYLLL